MIKLIARHRALIFYIIGILLGLISHLEFPLVRTVIFILGASATFSALILDD